MKSAVLASRSSKTQPLTLPQGAETGPNSVPESSLPRRGVVRRPNVAFKYAGRGWLAENLACVKQPPASELGNAVADILGQAYGGLYHLEDSALWHKRTVWQDERVIRIVTRRELASVDFCDLTDLVLLTHEFGLRLAIRGAANGYLCLQFTTPDMFWGEPPTADTIADWFSGRYPKAAP